jgi:hypothetical protein
MHVVIVLLLIDVRNIRNTDYELEALSQWQLSKGFDNDKVIV